VRLDDAANDHLRTVRLAYVALTNQKEPQVAALNVRVFLNGKILYRGRSAQGFRDSGFLGIVNPENDAVYLPLKKGSNELTLAVSELGGGWGFVCRLADIGN